MNGNYGITREAEEQKLKETILLAEQKLQETRQSAKNLADELHEMLEVFDEDDKESQTLWNNTSAMFREVSQTVKRAERARKKPYFGRIDFRDNKLKMDEVYYIGRSAIAKNPSEPDVIDWRAPVSSVYYESGLGETSYSVRGEGKYKITLSRKRTYEIEDDRLKNFYDSDIIANDELLTKYLAKNKNAVLGNIIATIQQEQNEVIRKKPQYNMLIQGAAGSGKTTVAMHRISYILYNYELEYPPQDFYIIGSNQMLLNYITGVLPELDVYGVAQMTMEQLFIRLLYEDWDESSFTIKPVQKGITPPIKGTLHWFKDLAEFCYRYEQTVIPMEDVFIEKNKVVLLTKEAIGEIMENSRELSRADKITRLTEHLTAKLENEIGGRYYSYSNDEKKVLMRKAGYHFGRREWKGSIFELYDAFLAEQRKKGILVENPGTSFDVYDLAALAYLYKRIKEDEVIREAGHVIIDEAQDFGMMAYCSLKYCLSKCSYTIMGDVSQNISLDYGLNDWNELKSLMLPGECDYFGLLRKSYRNTVEISRFATEILYHGSFPLYPVEPIIRHGEDVRVIGCKTADELIKNTASEIERWLKSGRETIAVICANEAEVRLVHAGLQEFPLLPLNNEEMEFTNGVMVLSLENTKGLEFDSVLIFDASEVNYPAEDGYVKRLYVAATRALHELTVLCQGSLTKLIAEPVSEEKRRQAVLQPETKPQRTLVKVPEKTKKEIILEEVQEGDRILERRNMYGSRRIEVPQKPKASTAQQRSGSLPKQPEFGSLPDPEHLHPPGHSRINCSIRFVMKGKGYFDLSSSYGTLRIAPLAGDVIRVCFARGANTEFPDQLPEYKAVGFSYKKRENPSVIEFMTEKVIVHVEKKTGEVSFLTPKGKLLLTENQKLPRQIGNGQSWIYFDWQKNEKLKAREISDALGQRIDIPFAKYISFGRESRKSPGIILPDNYELFFAPGTKLICCRNPIYGSYLSIENNEIIDYYFRVL